MDVQPEDELAPGDVLHLVDERAVAVARRDPLPLEQAEGVRPRRSDSERVMLGDRRDVRAELPELAVDLGRGSADRRRDLEHRLHELGLHLRLELVTRDRGQEGVDVLNEVEAVRVEEHVLLLDSEGVRISLAEGVVEDADAPAKPLLVMLVDRSASCGP